MTASDPQVAVVVQGAARADDVPGLEAIAGEAELRSATTAAELADALPGAQVLLGWDFREASLREAWPRADRLRWIHWSGAGVDALLFPELVASDVVVTNARGVFDRAMAEYALGLVLAFAKRLPETLALQARREWRHRLTERIDGRVALVVGVGSIGRAIAGVLRAAGMHVEGVGRRGRSTDPDFGVVHAATELRAALSGADYVVVVVPLTPHTRGLLGAEELRAMKRSARLINLARGAIVDEAALIAALREERIAGAALDVFDAEPLPAESPLWSMPNVVVSPHMSGDFGGYPEVLAAGFVENFRRFRAGEKLRNRVDKASGFAASE